MHFPWFPVEPTLPIFNVSLKTTFEKEFIKTKETVINTESRLSWEQLFGPSVEQDFANRCYNDDDEDDDDDDNDNNNNNSNNNNMKITSTVV